MLIENFYHITTSSQEGNLIRATVKLNPAHAIFEGHFPGNPVVPGVCQIQMVEEVLNELSPLKYELKRTGYIKFLHLVNPITDDTISMELKLEKLEDHLTQVTASYHWNHLIVFKFKGYFNER